MEFQCDLKMATTIAAIGFLALLLRLYNTLVVKPNRLRSMLTKQGINGPSPTLFLGNLKEIKNSQSAKNRASISIETPISSVILPVFEQWRKQYGKLFVFSLGNAQILHVNDADMVKEITTCISWNLGKPAYQHKDRGPLLGNGIITSNSAVWAHQRKIIAPELYMNKVKKMVDLITESTSILIDSWNRIIGTEKGTTDIKIDEYLRSFAADVISRACFGSNYSKGEEIFLKLRKLQNTITKSAVSLGIPGMRYFPTKSNRETWALEKEVRHLILQVVRDRKDGAYEKDLLQMILEGAKTDMSQKATEQFIVDNCKNIYLAGYDTTSVSATWCLMLLSANQEWQDSVRAEVFEVCKGRNPDADMLSKMKTLTMVIYESLRLYSPAISMSREALEDIKFGNINVPKGVGIWILSSCVHTDPEVWGPDSYKFNPERFANGIAGACKFPHLYMPFGIGPRVCLGQHLAMTELKILISTIVSKFALSLSPKYIHSPTIRLVLEPEYGVNILVKKL